jgi:two-component system CheB/CheR fusion protein
MGPTVPSVFSRYGFALLAITLALLARHLLDPLFEDRLPFLIVCLAVVAVAWHGGFGPSFLALVLGIFASAYLFVPPRYAVGESLSAHQVQAGGVLFLGLTIGLFSERLRSARRRAEAQTREAVRQQRILELEVAERKRLEQELHQRAEELAEADRRKDEFLAMLGHELRNPLAPIRNAVQVMRLLGLTEPKLKWARDVIDRQVGQLARLVDDLLDVSRIRRGKIPLHKEFVELTAIITQAVEISRPLLEARRQTLTEVLPADPVWLEADPMRLAQVVANLLNNACKYTEEAGQIHLNGRQEGPEMVLRVKDNGVGIAPEMLPRVFDLFAQADHTLNRAEGGLGIGLTLVKSVVELHGGRVEAFSEGLGRGSEFVVRLPVLQPGSAPSVPSTPRAVGVSGSARRVLAVDDNVDSAESLGMLLRVQGHEVCTAHDGPAAVEAARSFGPEVVLLDLGLPGMDGYEVARRLRRQPGLESVLLVALTGYGQDEDRRKTMEAGFDAHLTKPADPAALQLLLAGAAPGA